jgi:hypothetical protein
MCPPGGQAAAGAGKLSGAAGEHPSPLPLSFNAEAFKSAILEAKERAVQLTDLQSELKQFAWFKACGDGLVWGGRALALAFGLSVWSRGFSVLTALGIVLAAAMTGFGNCVRFGITHHHSSHGGYEKVPGHARARFAMGGVLSRLRDWTDWVSKTGRFATWAK